MAFIVENGSGVADANAYVTVAFVTIYLADRNRQAENSWDGLSSPERQAAIIQATDYIEGRFRELFRGRKQFLALILAKGTLTFTNNPADTETVVIGARTYTFNTVLGGADSILIGANASVSLDNLILAVNNGSGEGTLYGTGTIVHPDVAAEAFSGDTMTAEAKESGLAGNLITTTTTVTGATWSATTLLGGSDVGTPQPLSFPRLDLLDRDSVRIFGIPNRLKQAVAEYAIRAVEAILRPDPTTDVTGGEVILKREKVGPIEEETEYREGGRLSTSKPYPAADALLQEFLQFGGTVMRA